MMIILIYKVKHNDERMIIIRNEVNKCGKIEPLAGLSEAAEILGWSKQQVSVYIKRGKFPEPVQILASGPIWLKSQIEDYKDSRKG